MILRVVGLGASAAVVGSFSLFLDECIGFSMLKEVEMADIVLFVLVEGSAATDKLGLPPAVDWLVRHASAMIV